MADKLQRSSEGSTGLRRKKSFQGHQYRRRTKPISEQYKADLSKVLGLTVRNNCAFACNEATGNIAFPAGCIIVVCQVRKNKEFHIFNPGHKSITCIQISLDGQYIVTGESGHLPCVRVFSVTERCQIASFQSHKFGISCVAFSPNSQYITSIGYQHDNVINVWNWRKNALAASNKVSIKVRAVAFSEDSRRFVTVGNRHVKFWYIEQSKVPDTETVPLKGRSGLLGSNRNLLFCDVACGVGGDSEYTYALSRNAMLCQFDEKRNLASSVQLEASTGFCMSVVNGMIVCGCGEGKVLLHSSCDLQLLSAFAPSDHDTGPHDLVAVSMDSNNMWVHCVHNDHTMRIWDLLDFEKPIIYSAHSFHSDCVWDIKGLPLSDTENSAFYTCSNDASVKLWDLKDDTCELKNNIAISTGNAVLTPSNPKGGKIGIRSLCVSRDANFLAAGDRNGVIHIYRTEGGEHQRVKQVDMHSGDILSLAFNTPNGTLASASRDRCIYILDSKQEPTYTINDHSAAVTAVEFVHLNNKLHLISCGVDKSLYFCTVDNVDGRVEIVRDQHIVEKHAMHDMTIVKDSVLVACGANLREYDIDSGKSQRCMKGCESLATIIRVTTNIENTIISISCADKFIYLLNYLSGDCLLELGGHSEICTALTFINTNSDTKLVTASADSCIFTWKLTRCAKIEDNVLSFQSPLSPRIENEMEEVDASTKDADMTEYFGTPGLNDTIIGETTEEGVNGSAGNEEMEVGEMSTGQGHVDLDASLPTWLTGNKDKVVKVKKPMGKWASRFQDDVISLDTPRTELWENMNTDESEVEDEMEESEEEDEDKSKEIENTATSVENDEEKIKPMTIDPDTIDEEVLEDSIDGEQVGNNLKRMNGNHGHTNSEESNKHIEEVTLEESAVKVEPAVIEESTVRGEAVTKEEIEQDDEAAIAETSVTSTDYASAMDGSEEECHSLCKNDENAAPKKFKSEVAITVTQAISTFEPVKPESSYQSNDNMQNGTIDQAVSVDSESSAGSSPEKATNNQSDVPPGFLDLIQNLKKKKPRSLPRSLPVRSSYNFKGTGRDRSASDMANYMLTQPSIVKNPSPTLPQKEPTVSSDTSASSSSDECQEAVDNLMNAYERAESVYHKVSLESSLDISAQTLLSSTFSSLKERIDQLQLKMVEDQPVKTMDIDSLPPVLSLLREYSDKLCCMVREEIRTKNVVKE